MNKKIFLVAGEPSGDLHASKLAEEIKKIDPCITLMGIGGANMASQGIRLFHRTDELAIVGVFDIFKHFKKIKKIFASILKTIEEAKVDLVILVDYPCFNLKLARELKKKGIKIIYYISPQVWAWGKNRISNIKRYVDKIIVLFEFEVELYKKAGVPVEFTGHPILDTAKISLSKDAIIEKLQLDRTKKTITLLPGSRRREIELLLPVMLSASQKIYKKSRNIQFLIVKSPSLRSEIFERKLRGFEVPFRLVENRKSKLYECLSISDLAIAASGTVTLECAIMNVPVIIIYKVSLLNAIVMKLFMRVRYVGLVNILGGRKIVPELIQYNATAGNIFKEAGRILFEPGRSDWIKSELFRVKKYLGESGASRRAAISVVNFLKPPLY